MLQVPIHLHHQILAVLTEAVCTEARQTHGQKSHLHVCWVPTELELPSHSNENSTLRIGRTGLALLHSWSEPNQRWAITQTIQNFCKTEAGWNLTSDIELWKEIHMTRSHCKLTNNMTCQDCVFSLKPTRPVGMFSEGNYVCEAQDTWFRKVTINVVKESTVFIENMNKLLIYPKEGGKNSSENSKNVQVCGWMKWERKFKIWKLNSVKI